MDELRRLIEKNQDWLMEIILGYVEKYGFTEDTSTLEEDWRLSIAGLSSSLVEGSRHYPSAPELGGDNSDADDPLTGFGMTEARRHRQSSAGMAMFLGLMKCYRQSYLDLVELKCTARRKINDYRYFLERCFDRIEIAVCRDWTAKEQKTMIEEERLKVLLQMAGATAHELNQPLMALLGYIELMTMDRNNPEKVAKYSTQIEDAGRRIAEIVKKIQAIRHDEVKHFGGEATILKLDKAVHILSVEDNELDFRKIKAAIENPKLIRMEHAGDSVDAMEMLETQFFDLIFLDYALPSCTALDFLRLMVEKELEIPVVVITGKGDEMIASRVIQAGAYDYLPKSRISKKSLTRIIHNTLEKFRMKQESKQVVQKMAGLSAKDELTDLYNRSYFMEFAEREVSGAARYGQYLTLCMLDLDNFKQVNDAYGHPAGDAVLKETARLLRESIRQYDLPCRCGGEQFAVIMPNTRLIDAQAFCERLRKKIEETPVRYDSKDIQFTVSIGLAQFSPAADKSITGLIKRVDDGLYAAKQQGRNRVVAATDQTEQQTAGGMQAQPCYPSPDGPVGANRSSRLSGNRP
jgi:two-component system cell cycle response regulator